MKYKLEDITTGSEIRFCYVILTKYIIFVTFICKKKKEQKQIDHKAFSAVSGK